MPSAKPFHENWHLARLGILVQYKVRTGDSIKSIAEAIGMTWQQLALLNFGTEDPNEIHWYLKHFFVCTKKCGDGYNFMFTSQDEPGVLVLPKPHVLASGGSLRGTFPVSRFLPR